MLDSIPGEVVRLAAELPRRANGRIDYARSREAPVLDAYVRSGGRLLILRRRYPLAGVEQAWHVVSGFLDQLCTLREQVEEELREETGIVRVAGMRALRPYRHRHDRLWTVYPVLVEIAEACPVRLNEEHSAFAWIGAEEAAFYLQPQVYRAFLQADTDYDGTN